QAYREVLEIKPNAREAHTLLAFAVSRQGRADEALALFKSYTEKFPEDPEGLARLAAVYSDRGEHRAATDEIAKAIEVNPEDPGLYYEQGYYHELLEDWEGAQTAYEKASELDPGNDDFRQRLSFVYKKLGKTNELLASQEDLLEKEPDNRRLMLSVAQLSAEKGDYSTAGELFRRLAELDPGNTAYLKNYAVVQLLEGDTTGAASTYEKVVSTDPADVDAMVRLADAQASKAVGKQDAAVRNVQKGLDLDDQNARGWCVWGKILERQGMYEQAKQKFQRASSLGDPVWSDYARREVERQVQLIEREKKKKEKEEYEKLEEI
ncbi:MAG: tetratricopeptide repeat protein, partial [Candidatus Eisenbacteria bacterium]